MYIVECTEVCGAVSFRNSTCLSITTSVRAPRIKTSHHVNSHHTTMNPSDRTKEALIGTSLSPPMPLPFPPTNPHPPSTLRAPLRRNPRRHHKREKLLRRHILPIQDTACGEARRYKRVRCCTDARTRERLLHECAAGTDDKGAECWTGKLDRTFHF
jgi:hypothetical protein